MIYLEEYETIVDITSGERYTFCNVCGKKHKKNHGIRLSYEFSDTCGSGIWNVCEDCQNAVMEKLKELLKVLISE